MQTNLTKYLEIPVKSNMYAAVHGELVYMCTLLCTAIMQCTYSYTQCKYVL